MLRSSPQLTGGFRIKHGLIHWEVTVEWKITPSHTILVAGVL